MIEEAGDDPIALVLAGGGARGAYEVGVLSVLLPELARDGGRRPTILIGNSVGAINATYLAAHAHEPVDEMMAHGRQLWEGFRWPSVFSRLASPTMALRAVKYLGQVLGVPRARLWSLLEPHPLKGTVEGCIDFDQLERNVVDERLVAAVVATSALTRRSVVFHRGGPDPPRDARRMIDYVPTSPLAVEHVLASTAIPAVFPSVCVEAPAAAQGWYVDGGTRMNAPLKPALELGARRIIMIGLSSLSPGPTEIAGSERPDAFAGISQMVQGMLDDQMVQDMHTLASKNSLAKAGAGRHRQVPYIAVTPQQPDTLEQLAERLFRRRYRGLRGLLRSPDILILGRLLGVRSAAQNATLLSMLLFDGDFAGELIALGEADANAWIAGRQGTGSLWRDELGS